VKRTRSGLYVHQNDIVRPVGYRRDGSPIWPISGGNPDFPVVVGTPTESSTTTDGTAHTIARPAGVAGQLSLVLFAHDSGTDLNVTAFSEETYTQFFRVDRLAGGWGTIGYYRWEDATEDTSFTITTDDSEKSCTIVYSISGAANPATQPPEATTMTAGSGSASPDPPSITPTGGTKDYLFIAGVNQDGEEANDDTWTSAVPANYGPARQTTSGTGGATGTNTSLVTAERALTAASEDPGTFTVAQALTYNAFTIAIHPAPPAISYPPGLLVTAPRRAA